MAHYFIHFGSIVEEHNFDSLESAKAFAEHRRESNHQQVMIKDGEYPYQTFVSHWHISSITGQGAWQAWKKVTPDWQN